MSASTVTGVDGFHIRAASFQPLRAAYVRGVLLDRIGIAPMGKRALAVGAGRGLLARELARLGFAVSAQEINPAVGWLGQQAAAREGLTIDYEIGEAGRLPYADQSFDVGYWADTLEVTPDLDTVLAEGARVLRPGGVFIYDTVARTRLSRLIYLGVMQSWRWTRIAPAGRYAWERLRDPDELAHKLARHGLRNEEIRGFLPANPVRMVQATRRARHGDIGDAELADLAGMRLAPAGKRPDVTYLGFAIRTG
jgi:2-polyprenyl-6-hydroxyphenyl methylase/3-demethylubiquinone-9 3-methyltransferase